MIRYVRQRPTGRAFPSRLKLDWLLLVLSKSDLSLLLRLASFAPPARWECLLRSRRFVVIEQEIGPDEVNIGSDRFGPMTDWFITKEAACSLTMLPLGVFANHSFVMFALYALWQPMTLAGRMPVVLPPTKGLLLL